MNIWSAAIIPRTALYDDEGEGRSTARGNNNRQMEVTGGVVGVTGTCRRETQETDKSKKVGKGKRQGVAKKRRGKAREGGGVGGQPGMVHTARCTSGREKVLVVVVRGTRVEATEECKRRGREVVSKNGERARRRREHK